MRNWARPLMALACLAALAVPARPAAGAPADDGFAQIGAYLDRQVAETRAPGTAMAIVRGEQVVYQRTWGVDGDGEPVTGRTPFLLGSVAKPFTALAVMQLVEADRVALDAPIRRYLPWFRLADGTAATTITVRQLLTHTSGLPNVAAKGLTDRFDNTADGLTRSVRDLAGIRPTAAPGRTHQYSDANYQILGALVETVSGQPFGTYLRHNVLEPLDMRHAVTTEAEAEAVGLPAGHRHHFGRPQRFDPPYDTSGVPYGYLAASLDDLTHFTLAQLNDGRYGDTQLLSPDGVAQSHTGQVPVGSRGRYGLGWRDTVLTGTDTRIVWHAGATPGYFSHVVLVPESDLAVVVLSNVYSLPMDPPLAATAFNLVRIMHGHAATTATEEPLFTWTRIGLVAFAGLLLAGLVWAVFRTVRQRRSATRHGRTAARDGRTAARDGIEPARGRIIAGAAGWLAGCAALVAGALWGLPAALGGSGPAQVLLWALDIGQTLVAIAVLATALALVRIVRTGYALAGSRPTGSPQRQDGQDRGQ